MLIVAAIGTFLVLPMRYQVLCRKVDDDLSLHGSQQATSQKAFEEAQHSVTKGVPWPPVVFVEDVLWWGAPSGPS